MKGRITLAIIFLVYSPIFAQWNETFDDGEFTSNPTWLGNTDEFIIEAGQLRLNAPAQTGSSSLATSSNISLTASWSFRVRLDFNPSSSNYTKVYVMADTEDLSLVNNGYYVKIGGTPDEISFYKVFDGNESLLVDGANGRVSLSSVDVEIQVTRDLNHNWEIKSKLAGESSFTSEGNAVDTDITSSVYFGLFCKYTSTRSNKFYFDDFSVSGTSFIDIVPPVLAGYSTPKNTQILLGFSEPLDTTEAKNNIHFQLNGSSLPTTVSAISGDTLLLEFEEEIALVNMLNLIAIPDTVGNLLDTALQVVFIDPKPYNYRDLVINEIFPDPSPQEDLPVFEFVELYNNSNRILSLNEWTFTDGAKTATLAPFLLFPDSFLLICPLDALAEYSQYGSTMGLPIWPTLNNSGDALKIMDQNGTLIDSTTYSSSWYKNTDKDDGGWSLEQINPLSKCLGAYNWAASTSLSGGTPGQVNAIQDMTVDTAPPIIIQALLTDSLMDIITSEPIVPKQYQATLLPSSILAVFEILSPTNQLRFYINNENNSDSIIEIALEDCQSNSGLANANIIHIAQPLKNDIIINEVLFDPYTGGEDFVELFNASNAFFNLNGFTLGNGDSYDIITDSALVFPPQHFLALSEDIVFLKNEYLAPDSSLVSSNLPSYPNDAGSIILKSNMEETLDSVYYSEDYHFSLILNTEGVSLERISSSGNSLDPNNWRSAAESTEFATPGYKNAQSMETSLGGEITVSPEVITPNNDGQADYCQIGYSLDGQAQTISIAIYNINGQQIKTIAQNEIISPQGFFTWDGTNEQGGVLPTAHYIIVSEIITSEGRVVTYKNKVVVANGF